MNLDHSLENLVKTSFFSWKLFEGLRVMFNTSFEIFVKFNQINLKVIKLKKNFSFKTKLLWDSFQYHESFLKAAWKSWCLQIMY